MKNIIKLILMFLFATTLITYGDYIRVSGRAIITSSQCTELPDVFKKRGETITNYQTATNRHFSDGWRILENFEIPDGYVASEGSRTLTYDYDNGIVIEDMQIKTIADAEIERQDEKDQILKACDNSLIELLKLLTILPTDATTAQGLDRKTIEYQLLVIGMNDRTTETGNLLSRLKSTLDLMEQYGGNPTDAILHVIE